MLGWGLLSENGDQPSVLQKVTVPFLPYGNVLQLPMMMNMPDNGDDDDDDDDGVYLKAVNIDLRANLQIIKSVNLKYL